MRERNRLIAETVSPKRLYNTVKEVSSFHRIQASTGYRKAAECCKRMLDREGIEAQILSYTAKPDQWFLDNQMFLEWDLKDAVLNLEEPFIRLADVHEEPMSIIQRSYPCDFSEGVDLVYLDKGSDSESYRDVDLKGKLIFVRDEFKSFLGWAVKEKGAIGVVTDWINEVPGVRTRYDLYDSLNYTSFWWNGSEEEPKCFGFVLSPKMGDKLAELCEERRAAFERKEAESPYLRCSGRVESSLYPGKIEVVEARIPGETDEEVCLSAHLCHPKSSCNDNASGVAAAMEAMRVIKRLTESGKLKKNRRTIKMILIPEFTGTYAYLSDHTNYSACVGAINLDMVGGKQTRAYGPITLTGLPYSTPSFIEDLTALCMDYANKEVPDMDGELIPETNTVRELFAGGSDHIVFADPSVGIPCCMIGQWPDLNYHTATDTLEVIDPQVLAFSCRLAALFAVSLSNLDEKDMREIQNKAHVSLEQRIHAIVQDVLEGKNTEKEAEERLEHVKRFYLEAAADYRRVIKECGSQIAREETWIGQVVEAAREYMRAGAAENGKKLEVQTSGREPDTRIYKRNYIAPLHRVAHNAAGHPECQELLKKYLKLYDETGHKAYTIETLTQFYVNGKRTVDEIEKMVFCDTNVRDCKVLMDMWLELLEKIGLIERV